MRKLMVIVWLALPAAAAAQGGQDGRTGRITGRVTDIGSGTALAGAGVRVADATTDVLTNAEGWFTITGVPSGTVTLTIRKLGYAPRTVTPVSVDSGTTAERDVALTPKPFIPTTQPTSASAPPGIASETLATRACPNSTDERYIERSNERTELRLWRERSALGAPSSGVGRGRRAYRRDRHRLQLDPAGGC